MAKDYFGKATPKQLRERSIRTAGMSYTPKKGYILVGYDRSGRAVYSDEKLAKSNDTNLGRAKVDMLSSVFKTLGVANDTDATALDYIASASSDLGFMGSLYEAQQAKDAKAFVNLMTGKFKNPIIEATVKGKQNKAGARAGFSAWNLYNNWDRMSNAQRALGVAQIGLDSFRFTDGKGIANKPLFEAIKVDGKVVVPGLNTGQALNMMANGVDIYTTAKNWKDMSALAKIGGGAQTASSVIRTAQQLGYVSKGASAASAGASGASAGAKAGTSAASMSTGTLGKIAKGAGQVAGAVALYTGTKGIIDNWGNDSAAGRKQGAMAGLSAGVGAMALIPGAGWIAAGAFVALGVLSGTVKTGKHKDQKKRDGIRDYLKNDIKLLDDKYGIALPDGTIADIGADGKTGQHAWTDKSRIGNNPYAREMMASYDVDYTNDLDYASSIPGISLARILSGGSDQAINQLGGQLSNGALGSIGFNKDFTEENFNVVMQNQRSMYAKAGIKDRAELEELIGIMEKDGRLSSAEATAAMQGANMLYGDKAYEEAKKLMEGRDRGIEVQQEIDKGEDQKAAELAAKEAAKNEELIKNQGIEITKEQSAAGSSNQEELKQVQDKVAKELEKKEAFENEQAQPKTDTANQPQIGNLIRKDV